MNGGCRLASPLGRVYFHLRAGLHRVAGADGSPSSSRWALLLCRLGFQGERAWPAYEPVAHAIAATVITDVSIGTPVPGQQSMAARSAEAGGILSFKESTDFVLGLTLDGAVTSQTADLRPDLPLVVHW